MTVQDESATTTATHGAILTDAAAAKAKALLDQEGREDLALASPSNRAGALACATTSSSTTGPSTAT